MFSVTSVQEYIQSCCRSKNWLSIDSAPVEKLYVSSASAPADFVGIRRSVSRIGLSEDAFISIAVSQTSVCFVLKSLLTVALLRRDQLTRLLSLQQKSTTWLPEAPSLWSLKARFPMLMPTPPSWLGLPYPLSRILWRLRSMELQLHLFHVLLSPSTNVPQFNRTAPAVVWQRLVTHWAIAELVSSSHIWPILIPTQGSIPKHLRWLELTYFYSGPCCCYCCSKRIRNQVQRILQDNGNRYSHYSCQPVSFIYCVTTKWYWPLIV